MIDVIFMNEKRNEIGFVYRYEKECITLTMRKESEGYVVFEPRRMKTYFLNDTQAELIMLITSGNSVESVVNIMKFENTDDSLNSIKDFLNFCCDSQLLSYYK